MDGFHHAQQHADYGRRLAPARERACSGAKKRKQRSQICQAQSIAFCWAYGHESLMIQSTACDRPQREPVSTSPTLAKLVGLWPVPSIMTGHVRALANYFPNQYPFLDVKSFTVSGPFPRPPTWQGILSAWFRRLQVILLEIAESSSLLFLVRAKDSWHDLACPPCTPTPCVVTCSMFSNSKP